MLSKPIRLFDAVVVGGGPCGTIAAGVLLDYWDSRPAPTGTDRRLLWVDDNEFKTCGRLSEYKEVPGNTPAGWLVKGWRGVNSFNFDANQKQRQARGPTLVDCQPNSYPELGLSVDALQDAAQTILGRPDVVGTGGRAVRFTRPDLEPSSEWTVSISRQPTRQQFPDPDPVPDLITRTPLVIAVPGMIQRQPPPEALRSRSQMFDLRDVISPPRCREIVRGREVPDHWVVVGNSHSGYLCVMNLVEAGVEVECITVICEDPVPVFNRNTCNPM